MKTATFEIKVYRKGNYCYVVPQTTSTEIEGLTKDVRIVRLTDNSEAWTFLGFNSDSEIRDYEFNISLIKKENGDAYTNEEFKDWKENNTGSSQILENAELNESVKVNNWHLQGTGALTIEANSQRSITIKVVTDCEVTIQGVTATWLEGDVVTYGNGSAEILNDIEIVSGEWFIIGNGTIPTL